MGEGLNDSGSFRFSGGQDVECWNDRTVPTISDDELIEMARAPSQSAGRCWRPISRTNGCVPRFRRCQCCHYRPSPARQGGSYMTWRLATGYAAAMLNEAKARIAIVRHIRWTDIGSFTSLGRQL